MGVLAARRARERQEHAATVAPAPAFGPTEQWDLPDPIGGNVVNPVGSIAGFAFVGTLAPSAGSGFKVASGNVVSADIGSHVAGQTAWTWLQTYKTGDLFGLKVLCEAALTGSTNRWQVVRKSSVTTVALGTNDAAAANSVTLAAGWHVIGQAFDGVSTRTLIVDGAVADTLTATPLAQDAFAWMSSVGGARADGGDTLSARWYAQALTAEQIAAQCAEMLA